MAEETTLSRDEQMEQEFPGAKDRIAAAESDTVH